MKYFAKLIPVEGEIKVGDIYLSKWRKEYKFYHYVHVTSITDTHYYWDNQPYTKDDAISKVKLFLISRDIQVGDEVLTCQTKDDYESQNYSIPMTVVSYAEHVYIIRHKNWEEGKTIPIPKKFCIKVIGEISPEATWVKDGDEVDEKDVELVISNHITETERAYSKSAPIDTDKGFYIKCKIKCPTCGTFH